MDIVLKKYLVLFGGIILLMGITAEPIDLLSQPTGLAYATHADQDDDDDKECFSDDDDDSSTSDDDNDGKQSDDNDVGDSSVSANTGTEHDDDDDSADDDDGDCIGGSGKAIDRSALLISGAQTYGSWMIPILLAALGFGIVIARKL